VNDGALRLREPSSVRRTQTRTRAPEIDSSSSPRAICHVPSWTGAAAALSDCGFAPAIQPAGHREVEDHAAAHGSAEAGDANDLGGIGRGRLEREAQRSVGDREVAGHEERDVPEIKLRQRLERAAPGIAAAAAGA
jgi:hypothetical protein